MPEPAAYRTRRSRAGCANSTAGALPRDGRAPFRGRSGWGWRSLQWRHPEKPRDLLAVERLALQERARQRVQLHQVGLDHLAGPGSTVGDDALDLRVDQDRGVLTVVLGARHFPPEEDVLLALAERERTHPVRHAPFADHLPGHLGRLLEIVAGAGRALLEHDLLRRSTAEQDRDAVDQILLRVVVLVVRRQLLGQAQRTAAGDDRHLVQGVGARQQVGDQRVAGFVIRDGLLLLFRNDHGATLHAHQDFVLRVLEVDHLHDLLVLTRSQEGRLVDEVGQVRAGESRRAARQHLQLDVGRERDAPGVHPQDLLPPLDVRAGHDDLTIEAARTKQRGIEDVRPVRRGDQDHAFVGLEAVHLDQELVQRLLPLVVAAAEPGTAMAPDRVDLVHEDDAGRVLLALLEQVAHTRRADADEHLHEVRARDREERHVGLAGDRLREEGLAGAGRTDEEHALGNLAAELLELGRVFQELDDLAELLLGLVHTGHVLERDLVLLLRDQTRPRLAKRERLGACALQLAHEEDPDGDEEQHRDPLQENGVPGIVVRRLDLDPNAFVPERFHEIRILGGKGLERRAVTQATVHRVAPERDLLDLVGVDFLQKIGEDDLAARRLLGLEEVEQEDDDQADHHPQGEVLIEAVHREKYTARAQGACGGGAGRPDRAQVAWPRSSTAMYGRFRCRPSWSRP